MRSPINIISLNCKGIKGNLDYVEHLLQNECDLMFVCEHWLKPCDLYQMNSHALSRAKLLPSKQWIKNLFKTYDSYLQTLQTTDFS